jgi:hypothetical protein
VVACTSSWMSGSGGMHVVMDEQQWWHARCRHG